MRIHTLIIFSISFFAFTVEDTYLLKINLEAGDKYTYIVTSDQKLDMIVSGQEMKMEQSFKMYMPSLVKEVSKKQITIGQLISRVVYSQNSAVTGENYCDTDNEALTKGNIGAAMLLGFSEVINKPIIMNLESTGKVKSVDVTSFPKAMQKELKGSFKNSQGYYHLPAHPVAIGDQWKSTYTLDLRGIAYEFLNSYTLDSVSTEKAFISLASEPVMHKGNKMEGTQSGTLVYDRGTGIVLKGNILQNLTITKVTAEVTKMKIESIIYLRGKLDN